MNGSRVVFVCCERFFCGQGVCCAELRCGVLFLVCVGVYIMYGGSYVDCVCE